MAWAEEGAGQLAAILESESSEEEEEEEEEDEEAAMAQHPSLGQEAGEAEERLAELEQASQALLAELSALETEFEIERTCRQRAEAYAAQVKQENKQLKRLSLAPTAALALPGEEPPEEDPDPAQRYGQQLEDLQEKISWLLAQRKDLTIQVQELQRQNQDLQDQGRFLGRVAPLCSPSPSPWRPGGGLGTAGPPRLSGVCLQRALKSFKRVSQIVTQDYCEAVQQLELEQDLRLHAEAFAHEMLVQKKEANRQSTILLQSAGPSAQLLAALQEVGRLTRALEEARQEQQQREKLAQDPPPQSQTPEPVAPAPPPPPLPPPAPAVPVDPLSAIRRRKGLADAQRSKPEADDAKARAVQEMMERIKNGVVLRPTKAQVPLGQGEAVVASKRRSAALELQGILGAMRRASRRSSGQRSSVKGRDRQLESILQRRRRAVDASLPAPDPPQQDQRDAAAAGRPDPGTA
ncbi:PREDICTED: shootin-1-like [Nipponia nippon]|uniref:shootin-1-like n=1 Tax=Nipponia nippon TaxID=128390 RepID=UPI0005113893|nr:PREDICTED: shootin-1-like [Nipponia nippon]